MLFKELTLTLLFATQALAIASFAQSNFELLDKPTGDQKDYFVFVNLNTSLVELNAYRKVAQKNGYGFIMIPKSDTVKLMAGTYENYIDRKCEEKPDDVLCQKWDTTLNADANAHPVNLDLELPAVFAALQDGYVRTLVFSGHNSDNGVSGDYLSSDTYLHTEIAKQMKAEIQKEPDFFSKMTFLGLWGCDSATVSDVENYTSFLPNLSIIGGYGDTAPAGIRPVSGTYLASAINLTNSLINAQSKAQLLTRINAVQGIQEVYAGLWIKTLNAGAFLYQHSSEGTTLEAYTHDCDPFLNERFPEEKKRIQAIYDGLEEIPHDQPGSQLRADYYDLTRNSTCYFHGNAHDEANSFLSPTRVGMLRFFDGVKENFVAVFNHYIKDDLEETILKDNREELVALAEQLSALDSDSKKLGMLINRYLVNLDETCFDFLLWHEKREKPPTAYCSLDVQDNWVVVDKDE